jgi:predicted small secreted protein
MKRTKRMRKAAAVSAVLIAVSLLPTGCVTLEPGGGGGHGGGF